MAQFQEKNTVLAADVQTLQKEITTAQERTDELAKALERMTTERNDASERFAKTCGQMQQQERHWLQQIQQLTHEKKLAQEQTDQALVVSAQLNERIMQLETLDAESKERRQSWRSRLPSLLANTRNC